MYCKFAGGGGGGGGGQDRCAQAIAQLSITYHVGEPGNEATNVV